MKPAPFVTPTALDPGNGAPEDGDPDENGFPFLLLAALALGGIGVAIFFATKKEKKKRKKRRKK
jgi:phosphotransferase system  glucose/maltose/N-acetylglucosamine-specific IIC component